jgi:spermidine synthase
MKGGSRGAAEDTENRASPRETVTLNRMTDEGRIWKRGGILLFVFFVSGLSALLYQIVWLKYLGLIFGNTVYAAATLIAVFLAGLGIGAFLFGRAFPRTPPLLLYAGAEALIGTLGAFSPNGFALLNRAFVAAFPSIHDSPLMMSLVRVGLAALFLLPPTILMGGTLPLLVRRFVGEREGSGKVVSALYAINTLGATTGVALAGFVLIPNVGLLATIFTAVVLNFTLAIVALLLLASDRQNDAPIIETAPATSIGMSTLAPTAVLLASLLMGLAAIADEVFWSRILVLHLGSSVYAYSLMLFSFLIGIGIGSAIIERFMARLDIARALGIVEIALAVVLALQIHLFGKFSDLLGLVVRPYIAIGSDSLFPPLLTAVLIALLIPTALMGAAFPLTVRLYEINARRGEASAVGNVYLANTIGCISGSLLAGFILIRAIGSQNGLFVMSGISLCVGAWLLWRSARPRRWLAAIAAVIVVVAFAAAKKDEVILSAGLFSVENAPILLFREDVTATVTLRQLHPGFLSLELNGVNVAGTAGELIGTQKLQGHIPLLIHKNAKRVLHIGFGSGGTAWAVSRHPVANITIAEISPEVLEISNARLQSVNHGVLRDPRVHAAIGDGRNFVLATPEKFDVILSDSIHPRYAGNGSLYTKDYFELCRRRLLPGGVISMWLPMYSLTTHNYLQIVRAFRDVFPNTTIWYVPNVPNAFTIVIGRLEEGPIPFDRIAANWTPAVANELSPIGMRTPPDLLPAFMLGPHEVERITRFVDPHIDDIPSVEYESGRVLDRNGTWLQTFYLLTNNMTPLREGISAPGIDLASAEQRRQLLMQAHLKFITEGVRRERARRQ